MPNRRPAGTTGPSAAVSVRPSSRAKAAELRTKSGLMVGLGEEAEEVFDVMRDLRANGCDVLTIGQYLSPTRQHLPVHEYVAPETFDEYGRVGLELGFAHVESGPLVRSSYHADGHVV